MRMRVFLHFAAGFLGFLVAGDVTYGSALRITEFMASNTRTLRDETGIYNDWIEIQNTTDQPINLEGWFLTDTRRDLREWSFPATNLNAGAYMYVFASGFDRKVLGRPLHTNFRLGAGGEYLALVEPDGVTIATEFDFPQQAPDVSYGFSLSSSNVTLVRTDGSVQVQIPANGNDDTTWSTTNYDASAWLAGTNGVGYGSLAGITTPVQAAMSNVNASAYIRLPFTLTGASNIAQLTLRMRYDDGFVAFINGREVARVNLGTNLMFNAIAATNHSSTTAEDFPIGVGSGLLQEGANVLGIQGLNVSANDADFFILAEVIGVSRILESPEPLYMSVPTPGVANSFGVTYPGPVITDVGHLPSVPLDNEDVQVTARVYPSFFNVTNVTLRYRIMFSNEVSITMLDDGASGDGAAGDGVYGAKIPASAASPGQMIRYAIRALDANGNGSRWPLRTNTVGTAEYLGTIVEPVGVTSKLPIIHLFAAQGVLQPPGPAATGQSGADSQNGGQVSVFYDGEFYDNVTMELRGNTTAGFNKKSHKVEFNSEHPFRHRPDMPRVGNTSFVADYGDPSYMRQGLCFWMCNLIGNPGTFYDPVRLQLNGQFYQLANHNDVHDEDLLERLGYDRNGALYNAAGRVTFPIQSTGGFDKKTRNWDNAPGQGVGGYGSDYTNLTAKIVETNPARSTNLFDLFDIPNALSYLIVGRWTHENDDIWANLSLYHDNDGDDLWRIIGFDMNLSWGAIFFEGTVGPLIGDGLPGNVIGAFDAHKGHPLYGSSANVAVSGPSEPGGAGGSAFNRVYDVFFQTPATREMFLRRMRTVMDKYIKPPGIHPLEYTLERHILELRDQMAEDALRDRHVWGWPDRGGQNSFLPPPGEGASGLGRFGTAARTNAALTWFTNGVDYLISEFVVKRRQHFYVTHSITNTRAAIGTRTNNVAGIPLPQPEDAAVYVAAVDYSPSSANQNQEYICITNPNPYAVDISDWKMSGGVDFTFAGGTVIPSNQVMYVSPNVREFKSRATGPSGGQGLFIVGPYKGHLSARGEALIISNDLGRLVSSNRYVGSPSLVQQFLRITEIMYNPTPLLGNTSDAQEFEYMELKNISGSTTISLAGVHFGQGITFDFTSGAITSLAPGQRVLIVKNLAAFTQRYGGGLPVAGVYQGSLDNGGERLQLLDDKNEEILDFDYENDWYPVTDGAGFSLAIVDESADPDLWDSKTNWRPSGVENGAPGQPDTTPPTIAGILVNEVLSNTDPPLLDAVELFNPTANDVSIGGWFISDDFGTPKKFRIPNGTVITARGYRVFSEADWNPQQDTNSFAFSSAGDEVYIFSGDASSNLTGYAHGYQYGAAESGVSFGRYTNSVGAVHFVAQTSRTMPGPNAGPKVGPVVISEFMYHPPDNADGTDNSAEEYVELHNISSEEVPLYVLVQPTDTWRLRGGIDFDFPALVTIPANGFVLVVNFNVADTRALNNFRQKFNVPVDVPVFGPYEGKLNNDNDEIELKMPDLRLPDGTTPYIMVEQVDYMDSTPWPTIADGNGVSLHRIGGASYANDPVNWTAAAPSPGRAYATGSAPVITTQPADQNPLAEREGASFSVVAAGDPTLRYQWRFNGQNMDGATNATLSFSTVQVQDGGKYQVTVFNGAGAVTSSNATLNVRLPIYITSQPQPTIVGETSNAVLSVSVISAYPPVTYQWQAYRGDQWVNIPGATGNTLAINNARDVDDTLYRVNVADTVSSLTSAAARLTVLILPTMQQPVPPISLTAVAGETITFNAQLRGTMPIFTRWRLLRTVGGNVILNPDQTNTQPFISKIYTVTATDSGRVVMSITNVAGGGLSQITTNAFLTVLADTDGDRVPDVYEDAHGMDRTNPNDANGDLDGDGMSNRAEYIAGTDPQDPNSKLQVDGVQGGGPATVRFLAISNRGYTVQYSDALGSPWTKLADVTGRTTNRQASVVDPAPNSKRFYRLVTPVQP